MRFSSREEDRTPSAHLLGHQNPKQKIQLHVQIKKENNSLKAKSERQAEEIRRLHIAEALSFRRLALA